MFHVIYFRGIDVLRKKSELRRALDKRTEERRKKDQEHYLQNKKTAFEKVLETQANKYKEVIFHGYSVLTCINIRNKYV